MCIRAPKPKPCTPTFQYRLCSKCAVALPHLSCRMPESDLPPAWQPPHHSWGAGHPPRTGSWGAVRPGTRSSGWIYQTLMIFLFPLPTARLLPGPGIHTLSATIRPGQIGPGPFGRSLHSLLLTVLWLLTLGPPWAGT